MFDLLIRVSLTMRTLVLLFVSLTSVFGIGSFVPSHSGCNSSGQCSGSYNTTVNGRTTTTRYNVTPNGQYNVRQTTGGKTTTYSGYTTPYRYR